MLVSVTFAHVGASSAGKEIPEEEGNNRLAPSSTMLFERVSEWPFLVSVFFFWFLV